VSDTRHGAASNSTAVANIVGGFAHRIDARDFEAVAELLAHCTYRSNGIDYEVAGQADLAAFYERAVDFMNERWAGDPDDAETVRTKHVFTNLVIDVDDEAGRASCDYYGTVFSSSDAKPLEARWQGTYHDRFERHGDRWRIVERLQVSDYPAALRPGDLRTA
jgi:hypothetical protein